MQIEKLHSVTLSEHSRGYLYISANKRKHPEFATLAPVVTFLGHRLGPKKLTRGRIIIGKSLMSSMTFPGDSLKIMISLDSGITTIDKV